MTFDDFDDKKKKNDQEYPTFSWSQVWTMALTRPATATFETLLQDPQATAGRALRWIFFTGTTAFIGTQILNTLFRPSWTMNSGGVSLMCTLALGGVVSIVMFWLMSAMLQLIAKLLGGRGSYGAFHYAYAASYAPLTMINMLLSPFTGSTALSLLNIGLFFYSYLLAGMALRAVNGFGWGKAVAVMLAHFVILVAVAFGLVYLLISKLSFPGGSF